MLSREKHYSKEMNEQSFGGLREKRHAQGKNVLTIIKRPDTLTTPQDTHGRNPKGACLNTGRSFFMRDGIALILG
jgi:hypothetical protein